MGITLILACRRLIVRLVKIERENELPWHDLIAGSDTELDDLARSGRRDVECRLPRIENDQRVIAFNPVAGKDADIVDRDGATAAVTACAPAGWKRWNEDFKGSVHTRCRATCQRQFARFYRVVRSLSGRFGTDYTGDALPERSYARRTS